MKKPIDPKLKAEILDAIGKMLDEPSCVLGVSRGIRHYNVGDGWRHSEPTAGKTITISVHGGANEIDDTHEIEAE